MATPSPTTEAIPLVDPYENPSLLGDFAANPLVVILVRYFGCLPCQDYLCELTAARDRFPVASNLIAVGGSAAYQARWLEKARKVEIPMLLDVEQRVRSVAAVGNLTAWEFVKPGGLANYARAMRKGLPPQVPTSDIAKAPGIVMFDPAFQPIWVHRGRGLGDYPPVADVIAAAERHAV